MAVVVKRGDIYYADLGIGEGSEQGGVRPVLVIQNDLGNKFSPTVIVAAITSKMTKTKIPTHVEINAVKYGLPENSVVLLEQVRTIDKRRLQKKVGSLDKKIMDSINRSSGISIGLIDSRFNECYIQQKIYEIKDLDSFITKYKNKGNTDLTIEKLEKISLMGDIINYCKNFNVDSRIYLEEINFTNKVAI